MRPLDRAATGALLVAVFVVTLAYGVQLPLLPSLLERQFDSPAAVSWHTGALTGAYTFAMFLFAPLWGLVSDRWQRKGVILIGLAGFAGALTVFAFIDHLVTLYAGRVLSGAFAAAVLPASQALLADVSPDDGWRARRFAWLNIAGIGGFLLGPAIGGALGNMWSAQMPPSGAPFLTIALTSAVVALIASRLLPSGRSDRNGRMSGKERSRSRRELRLLLIASLLLAVGLGTFEVGLALVGELGLGLTPGAIGLMFAECMVVMAAAQLLVFNPWFPPRATRWLLAPAFAVFAIALLMLPLAASIPELFWTVAAIGAPAGVLSPVIAFWISLSAGEAQGSELGWQAAAASFGLGVGSVLGGLPLGMVGPLGLPFVIAAAAALVGASLTAAFVARPVRRARL